MSFTVDANVGGFIEPAPACDLNRLEGRDFQAAEEILLHVADTILNPPFFISFPDRTCHGLEAVMSGKVQITGIKLGALSEGMMEDAHLQVVDHDLAGNQTEELQRVTVAREELLHTFRK